VETSASKKSSVVTDFPFNIV